VREKCVAPATLTEVITSNQQWAATRCG